MARYGSYSDQLGGRRPSAGRPRFVPAASKRPARAMLKFDEELHSSWSTLKQWGGFHSDSQFVAHLLSLEEVYIYVHACVIPDRGTVWSGIRFYNYVMYRSAHARPVARSTVTVAYRYTRENVALKSQVWGSLTLAQL